MAAAAKIAEERELLERWNRLEYGPDGLAYVLTVPDGTVPRDRWVRAPRYDRRPLGD